MSPDVPGKGPVDETMRQRVHAIAQEAYRRRLEQTHPGHDIDAPTVILAIEIALSGWTPTEPVVAPDVLAFREWETRSGCSDAYRKEVLEGKWDHSVNARAYLAGARMATKRERKRAKGLVEYMQNRWDQRAYNILAKYRGEA